jgi:hypothetical protein
MQAKKFMVEDIQKSIDLEPKGAPNILIALGLSCYTEYWGKLLLGCPKENSKRCYEEFLKCLGDSYKPNPYQELLINGVWYDTFHFSRTYLKVQK